MVMRGRSLAAQLRRSSAPGSAADAWRGKRSPSVKEVAWHAQYGEGEGTRLRGVPKGVAKNASLAEQREYVDTRAELRGLPTRRRQPYRYVDVQAEARRRRVEEARRNFRDVDAAAANAPVLSDAEVSRRMTNLHRIAHTHVDWQLVSSFAQVDTSLQSVQKVVEGLDGIDSAFDRHIVHTADPPMLFIPNTIGAPKEKWRRVLATKDYTQSTRWYSEAPGKVVMVLSESGTSTIVDWAEQSPDTTYIVLADLVPGLFRNLTLCGDNVPANVKFVRTNLAFYFKHKKAIPDASIDEVILSFPPNYANHKSAHKRYPDKALLCLIHQKLKVGGLVRVETHNPDYHDWTTLQFETCYAPYERVEGSVDLPPSVLAIRESSTETLPSLLSGMCTGNKDRVSRVQEWQKKEATPERVYDINDEFQFVRVIHQALVSKTPYMPPQSKY